MRHLARGPALLGALLLVGVFGCFNPFAPNVLPERAIEIPPPVPNTPRNLMLLFEWAYERQDITVYEELFTDDYRFAFAAEDSAGSPPLTREEELIVARHLFIAGSATAPPANKITLDYESNLFAVDDSRPGKESPWHKQLNVRVFLRVETDDIEHTVRGKAVFYVVRGDSAQIPEELQLRGLLPDPNRWYIERWEDQTGNGFANDTEALRPALPEGLPRRAPAARATPVAHSWSTLKRIYR